MRPDDAHLLDIVNAARHVAEFCEGLDLESFRRDLKTQAAVLHEIAIMGEAAKRVSDELASRHPEIPWREIRGMRDRVIHEYHRVDVDLVWTVVERDIPRLIENLERLVPEP